MKLDLRTHRLIQYQANQLVGRHGFTRSDRDDLQQDLYLGLLSGMRRYDPARASGRTYASLILRRKISAIVESARAQRRDRRRVHDGLDLNLLPSRNPTPEQIDLRLDLPKVIARLPALDQRVAEALADVDQAKTARQLRLTRQQLRSARARIADHFVARGLAEKPEPEQPLCVGTP